METHNIGLILMVIVLSIMFVVSIIRTVLQFMLKEDRLVWTAISTIFLFYIGLLIKFYK